MPCARSDFAFGSGYFSLVVALGLAATTDNSHDKLWAQNFQTPSADTVRGFELSTHPPDTHEAKPNSGKGVHTPWQRVIAPAKVFPTVISAKASKTKKKNNN